MCENNCSLVDPSLEKQLKGHRNAITSLYFNPNEQQVASSSLDNSILLWNLRGTMKSYRFEGHDEAVMDVTFSQSGKYMASASRDKTVRIWIPTVTGSTGMFKAHSQTVRSVQFSLDGTKIVTGSDDKIVKLWSANKYKFISSFVGHTNWVRCARIANDSSIIASCSDDKTTRLWNPDSGKCIHTYKEQSGHGMYLAWHPSGCYIAVGTSNGTIKMYDIRTHELIQYYSIHDDAITQLVFHPCGSYILTASKDGKMKILDLLEGHPIYTLSGHSGPINTVNFSASGDSFASGGEDKLVFIWRTNFTQLGSEIKENVPLNPSTIPKSIPQASKLTSSTGKNQGSPRTVASAYTGTRIWYLCYHSIKYPVTEFVHMDNPLNVSDRGSELPEPSAHSTVIEESNVHISPVTSHRSVREGSTPHLVPRNVSMYTECDHIDCSSYNVGHINHIPRVPPSPATYIIPSIMEKSAMTEFFPQDLFGMIKLKENDVCYTSGTIEWVGRKRNYPINSGFKLMNDNDECRREPFVKKIKRLDKTTKCKLNKIKECDCADVLPTVNAIVDHLNALHEAVDLVDLRLGNLEETNCNIEK
ncbi:hypothetical protein K1T71_005249 [Dendrolimus kikuchii]|uniref:Uncharacterized protein n=1 Tax=Dendrolimus kikuchii TaxID=765133 RepID=A0ACC1D6S9_9NEOP|nr:hypothetical protein K1T71_005249 [Dendrolimus kikuchii]